MATFTGADCVQGLEALCVTARYTWRSVRPELQHFGWVEDRRLRHRQGRDTSPPLGAPYSAIKP